MTDQSARGTPRYTHDCRELTIVERDPLVRDISPIVYFFLSLRTQLVCTLLQQRLHLYIYV